MQIWHITVLLLVVLAPARSFGQAPAQVDFGRDVQPLLKEHCVGCHGPEQQMNGFRLDRRGDAMRGGTFPVIAPGNSVGSRFYLKLVGTEFGQQMPPTGRLPDDDIEILKNWIDQGAVWPDQFSGEAASRPQNPAAMRLMHALRAGDSAGFRRDLSVDPTAANGSGPGGATPLMHAVLYADAGAVRQLLQSGADPNATSDGGTTALMLAVHDADKTRLLLDAGADPNIRPIDGRTALIVAAGQPGSSPVLKLLLERGANALATTATRVSSVRLAAAAGDADAMRLLIAHGANIKAEAAAVLRNALLAKCRECWELVIGQVDRRGLSDALATIAPLPDADVVRMLLDRGADVNIADGDGNTPLILACNSDHSPIDVVRLLIERGADVHARTKSGQTAATLAAARGGPIADALVKAGAAAVANPALQPPAALPGHTVRAAVQLSLPLLEKADRVFLQKSGCVSCHHNSLTAMTLVRARSAGFGVNEDGVRDHLNRLGRYVESWRDSILRGAGIPGQQDTISYILLGMEAIGYHADAATDAMAHFLKARQQPDGHWRIVAHRPPLESSDIQVTAASLRALQVFHPATQRKEYEGAVALAARWLAANPATTTEDRAFQLLGLRWANHDKRIVAKLAQELLKQQRSDGGWSPLPDAAMQSDAYATGQALVALRETGVLAANAPAYMRGVTFLLRTQLADGSWHVRTRAFPLQANFDGGFPHERDQWISAAATNWATMALIPAAQVPAAATAPMPDPKSIDIPRIDAQVKIDGVLDEQAWQKAARLTPLLRNDTMTPARAATEVRVWYDQAALYLGWICEDYDIQATFTQRDSRFWEEEVVEFFVTPATLDRYFELQWNPLGGTFDAIIANELGPDGRSRQFKGDWSYTAANMTYAVRVDGSVQNSSDRDRRWTVEVRIPFADLKVPTPQRGDVWRSNFYRFNRDHDGEPEQISWSPTILPGFHQPTRFGYLRFSGN